MLPNVLSSNLIVNIIPWCSQGNLKENLSFPDRSNRHRHVASHSHLCLECKCELQGRAHILTFRDLQLHEPLQEGLKELLHMDYYKIKISAFSIRLFLYLFACVGVSY